MQGFFILLIVSTVTYFCILSLGGLSGLFSEKVGIVNIGINGTMIIGGTTYAILAKAFAEGLGTTSGFLQIPLFFISAVIGMVFSWLHGFATIKLKSDHVISGVAINSLAVGVALTLIVATTGGLSHINFSIQELALNQDKISSFGNILSLKIFLVIAIAIVAFFALQKTKWGLRFKAIGENPHAADVAGVNVNKYKWQGISISGILGGLSGAIFSQNAGAIFSGNVAGLGFLAIAILIMGQWNVILILISSFGFSSIYGLTIALSGSTWEALGTINNYSKLISTIPFIVTLVVLIFTSKNSKAPKASGIAYNKSKS